jgi:phage shock protein PspC (stress-responsive transcriptional regulator)
MNDPSPAGGIPRPIRSLRRSQTDRMITGVSGGLGEYFGVDPVIFRVFFAVLSFFGGVGLLVYLACWLLMPEPDVEVSNLDKVIGQLRVRRVPPWLVIGGGAVVLWIGWFSWWAPGPTFPALAVLAVLLIVLVRRLSMPTPPGWVGGPRPHAPYPWEQQTVAGQGPLAEQEPVSAHETLPGQETAAGQAESSEAAIERMFGPEGAPRETTEFPAGAPTSPTGSSAPPPGAMGTATGAIGSASAMGSAAGRFDQPTDRLAPPLNDARRSMGAWYAEARQAQQRRRARRRPIRIAIGVTVLVGLAVIGIVDAINGISAATYLWFLLAVLGGGFVISVLSRRTVWEAGWFTLPLIPALIVLGGTHASLKDGSGRTGVSPTNVSQLTDLKQFAGQTTFDLTHLQSVSSDRTVSIRQGAGEVLLRIPSAMNVTVDATVHAGDIQVGTSHEVGQYVSGLNTSLSVPPGSTTTKPSLTIKVNLTVGHVQIDRIS